MTPRLSVIIPVRNDVDFVTRAIVSAQAIPVEALEIVVVDDGSTDGTRDLLRRLAAEDPRIALVFRDRDHGASAARNEGIGKARAEVVCFLDADDALFGEPIARRLEWLEAHPQIVLCFSKYQTLLPNGSIEPIFMGYCPRFEKFLSGKRGVVELGDAAFPMLYSENPICTTGTMARRDALLALGGFDRDLRQAEDWDLWIRLAQHGPVAYSTDIESQHTARPGSLSTNIEDRTRHIAEVSRRHRAYALRHYPAAAFAGKSLVEIGKAEQNRQAGRNLAAWGHYLAGFLFRPNVRTSLEFLRSSAVVVGLREGKAETYEDRARRMGGEPASPSSNPENEHKRVA